MGIRGLIFDLDNTIIPWGSTVLPSHIAEWLKGIINSGYKVCLVSNNRQDRVESVAQALNIPYVPRAYKPAKTGFRRAVGLMCLTPAEVAVIGDQLFTDVLGGNRMGLFTIWVSPLSSREFIGTKLSRQLEKLIIYILKNKGLLK